MSPYENGAFTGRVWRDDVSGPSVVAIRNGDIWDITSNIIPTMSHLLEMLDPVKYVRDFTGEKLGSIEEIEEISLDSARTNKKSPLLYLSPCDLQTIKACGVTFANSMVERVIEERASGDLSKAEALRNQIGDMLGDNLRNIIPGSKQAFEIKKVLIDQGLWSQYLEVGIGEDAEVFTKSPVLSSVGHCADIGLHPMSTWNNPEPEIVLAVDSRGIIKGVTLGNDVNLRDVEGRSALLLGKSKDNNASCSIGPFIRLFDNDFGIEQIRSAQIDLTVTGQDGYELNGSSSMIEISRDPLDLVKQTCGPHHQYPDGFMLFLGTSFAPTEDREIIGEGFTHKVGDVVTISEPQIGTLINTVQLSTTCPSWDFGISALINNLSNRKLLA